MRARDKCTLAAFQFLMIFLVKEKLAFVLAEKHQSSISQNAICICCLVASFSEREMKSLALFIQMGGHSLFHEGRSYWPLK